MPLPSFGELLLQHMQRAGISDSELARTIGVQRQTIFRWKEGLVARPRLREDVLRIAHKLRLTPEERDQLLLAAGFPPETAPVTLPHPVDPPVTFLPDSAVDVKQQAAQAPVEQTVVADAHSAERVAPLPLPPFATKATFQRWLLLSLVALILTLAAALFVLRVPRLTFLPVMPITPTPPAPTATPVAAHTLYPSAQPDERLLLVAQFAGYTNEQFNVAGRIAEALEKAVAIPGVRVAIWPDALTRQAEAEAALTTAGATLIIWGEYDSGRVRANLTLSDRLLTQHIDFPLTSPSDLVATINEDVPAEVQMFALLTAGNLYPRDEFYAAAAQKFQQALALQPSQQSTRALLNFYLARTVSEGRTLPDLERAIAHYTEALTLNPRLYDALYNRGTLWLNRSYLLEAGSAEIRHSLDNAITDLTQTLTVRPRFVDGWLNRGIALYERNTGKDLAEAIQNFNRVIELEPNGYAGYYHRGLAQIRAGNDALWAADFERTLEIQPGYASAYNALCWGYALSQQPEHALLYCDRAVELDATGASHDGRGIVLSGLGRHPEAIDEFEAYLAWVRTLKPASLFERLRGPQVEQWIAQLKQGANPFTPELLDTLRN